jgi:hypothetical protein
VAKFGEIKDLPSAYRSKGSCRLYLGIASGQICAALPADAPATHVPEHAKWGVENIAASAALAKGQLTVSDTLPAGMDPTSGTEPETHMMLDDGSFRHLARRNAMHLATNIRKIDPYPVQSATGDVKYLVEECDLILNNCEFLNCLVNPHHEMTLISEGWLHLADKWSFVSNSSGKLITTP